MDEQLQKENPIQPDYSPRQARILAFVSGKGGVGKTTLVSNLGLAMVKKFHLKVLVVDTCFSAPTLSLHLGVLYPSATVHDVLENRVPVEEAIYAHSSGLHIMPASLSAKRPEVDYDRLRAKLSQISENYDYILLDGSAGVDDETKASIRSSDEVVVVTNPDIPSITSAIKVIETVKDFGIPVRGIILNKIHGADYEATGREIEASTDQKLIGMVRFDKIVPESISSSTPIFLYSPNSSPTISILEIASSLTGLPFEKPQTGIVNTIMDSLIGRKEKRERPSMETIVRHLGEQAQRVELPASPKREPVEVIYDDETQKAISQVRRVISALEDEYKEGIISAESYRELRKYNNEKLKGLLAKGTPIYERKQEGDRQVSDPHAESGMVKELLDTLRMQKEEGIISEEEYREMRQQALEMPEPAQQKNEKHEKTHKSRKTTRHRSSRRGGRRR